MDDCTTDLLPGPYLLLADQARLCIPLARSATIPLQTWLVVELPGPTATEHREGRFCAEPRLPESEIELRWGTSPATPEPLRVLTVSLGDRCWELEQDIHNRKRWLHQPDPDRLRGWS
jgi:hypothetical protein